jgi:hypothetical protein
MNMLRMKRPVAALLLGSALAVGCKGSVDPDDKPDAGYLTIRNQQPKTVTTAWIMECAFTGTPVDSLLPRERIRTDAVRTFRFESPACYDATFLQDTAANEAGEMIVDTIAKRYRMQIAPGDTFVVTLIP